MKGFDPAPCSKQTVCIICRCSDKGKNVINNVCFFTKVRNQLTIEKERWYCWEFFIIKQTV